MRAVEERLRTEREGEDRIAAEEERAAAVESVESVVEEERAAGMQIAKTSRREERRERKRAERRARNELRRQQAAEEMAQAEQRLLETASEHTDWADRENERWRRRQQTERQEAEELETVPYSKVGAWSSSDVHTREEAIQ
jgi:hypothetical protein